MTKIYSFCLRGIIGLPVSVELDLSNGLPAFDIVGLPDQAVKESKERVRSAIKNCGIYLPQKKVTVNLAPANVKKEGPIYDLPIFVALLNESGEMTAELSDYAFLGELALDGAVRRVDGALPMAISARETGIANLIVPKENAAECAVVEGLNVLGAAHVKEVLDHFSGRELVPEKKPDFFPGREDEFLDFADVQGQADVKRAMEIAAAGFHNALLIGSPGSGKSMIAKRLPSILPPLTYDESIEIAKIHSVAGLLSASEPFINVRPFRAPHHTVSPAGLSGGGLRQTPGEISLAHGGVLFLDEFPEFAKPSRELLRQPLEDGTVTITRAAGSVMYPARFMLVCAMNPCRCGFFGHPKKACLCQPAQVNQYLQRVSGPLLDRIDLHIDVSPVPFEAISGRERGESSKDILKRVMEARERQKERYKNMPFDTNSALTTTHLREFCPLGDSELEILKSAFERLNLSARAYERIIKVARSIADLGGAKDIGKAHILEAIQYRSLDRKYFSK